MIPGIVAESDLTGALKSEYVFFNGERTARRDFGPTGPTGVFYYFSDHLKTASVITDASGNIKSDSDYYPWGGELQFVANDSNHYKFTGKERDTETGLDYFGARYYSNGLGRFITPDWAAKAAAVPYADFADPQSLNLYTYVRDIPTAKADLDGHDGSQTETLSEPTAADWELIGDAAPVPAVIPIIVFGAPPIAAAVIAGTVGPKFAPDPTCLGPYCDMYMFSGSTDQNTPQQSQTQDQNQGHEKPPEAAAAGGGKKKGGGRNAQKQNQNKSASAQDKYNEAKADYEKASKLPPGQARKKAMDQAKKEMKHWQKKAAQKSETHSRKHKGQ